MKVIAFSKWLQNQETEEIAEVIRASGFDGVDLPVRKDSNINPENAFTKLPEAKKIFEDQGLKIEQLVTGITKVEPDLEKFLDLLNKTGIKKIRLGNVKIMGSPHDKPRDQLEMARFNLEKLEAVFEKHDISAGIQNHTGPVIESNIGFCLYILQGRNPKFLGIQLDPGHLSISGEEPELAIDLCGPYLHSFNIKASRKEPVIEKSTGALIWATNWIPLRDGMVNWHSVLKKLKQAGYNGAVSIHAEYRSPYYRIDKDIEAVNRLVNDDVRYIRNIISSFDCPS